MIALGLAGGRAGCQRLENAHWIVDDGRLGRAVLCCRLDGDVTVRLQANLRACTIAALIMIPCDDMANQAMAAETTSRSGCHPVQSYRRSTPHGMLPCHTYQPTAASSKCRVRAHDEGLLRQLTARKAIVFDIPLPAPASTKPQAERIPGVIPSVSQCCCAVGCDASKARWRQQCSPEGDVAGAKQVSHLLAEPSLRCRRRLFEAEGMASSWA